VRGELVRWQHLDGDVEDLARWARRAGPSPVTFLDGNDGSARGRFSFLGLHPVETEIAVGEGDPLAVFDRLERTRDAVPDERELAPGLTVAQLPRWIGAVSYDLAWACRRELGLREGPFLSREQGPLAVFHRFEALIVGDRESGALYLVGESDVAMEHVRAELELLREGSIATARLGALEREERGVHAHAIEAALVSIADGDVYQINLARRWRASIEGESPARALMVAMREASPVPFGALLEWADASSTTRHALVARTMERFLRWDRASGRLETRPIKGTIARGEPRSDPERGQTLLRDQKERAEHAMIVDLMRNDLGRLAEIGSVEVSGAFEVEPYARLSHLVSTIRATSRPEITLREVVLATFPPGSVTGTPKLRAVERIEALERFPRGFYCGAIGHVDRAGGLDLAVAIRTAQVAGDELTYFAGGGIVDASVIERELDETELKARVLEDAIARLAS